jgi:hypothetical protein
MGVMDGKNRAVAMAGIGLALLLSACEKEMGYNRGGKVPVVFLTSTVGYDAANGGMRSAMTKEPETEVIPLGNDLFMYVTLREDAVEEQNELRAGLFDNQKVRFAAFNKTSGLQEGTAVTYTYNGSKLVPDSGSDPLGVEPDDGTTYRFVAYSYYGDPETDPVETDIAPAKDLVWGAKEQLITDTEAGRRVEINMEHRFSRMRVKINAGAIATNIVDLTNVQLVGKATDLDIETGALSSGSASAAQSVENFSGTATVQTSDYYVFYSSPTTVSIESIILKIGGVDKTFYSLSTNFKEAWVGGTSYTLEVDIKKLAFAKSNIYWDVNAGELTFDKTGTVSGSQYFQGVFFRWGSLVGLSPTGFGSGTVLYVPESGGGWDGTQTVGSNTYGFDSWDAVPYSASGVVLYDEGFTAYTGDICSYLTDGVWRLPSASECGSLIAGSWVSGTASFDLEGTGAITSGRSFSSPVTLRLPDGGSYRHEWNGFYNPAQGAGYMYYMTGTSGYYLQSWYFTIGSTLYDKTAVVNDLPRERNGMPARCVTN